jgi:two-component system, NarL family, nitrate/nitrite response regulator NarL
MVDIVLGDDHTAFADALAAVLTDHGHRVVAVERTAAGVLAAVQEASPDVCLLDRWFDDADALELLPELSACSPPTKIVMITADPDRDVARQALDRGARGFVHKTRGVSALFNAISRVAAGEIVTELPPRGIAPRSSEAEHAQRLAAHLTARETECLALLVEGANTSEIAARLAVSVTTVRTHVQAVMTKLGVHTRLEAAAYAVRHGLVPPTPEARERRA